MMWQALLNFLGADRYSQHAICLSNDPIILTVFVGSDLFIWLSYFTIGSALLWKRHLIASLSPSAVGLYGAFIFLCGLNHLTMVFTQFAGVYLLDAAVKAATAGVSTVTAVYTCLAIFFDEAPGATVAAGE